MSWWKIFFPRDTKEANWDFQLIQWIHELVGCPHSEWLYSFMIIIIIIFFLKKSPSPPSSCIIHNPWLPCEKNLYSQRLTAFIRSVCHDMLILITLLIKTYIMKLPCCLVHRKINPQVHHSNQNHYYLIPRDNLFYVHCPQRYVFIKKDKLESSSSICKVYK